MSLGFKRLKLQKKQVEGKVFGPSEDWQYCTVTYCLGKILKIIRRERVVHLGVLEVSTG